ncbi:MAG: cytochrome c maturation protein CcmE [Actinomycetota bacterium]
MSTNDEAGPEGQSNSGGSSPGLTRPLSQQALERPKRKTTQVILIVVVLAMALGASVNIFRRSVVYYHTTSEVVALKGQQVRLSGQVVPGTIRFDYEKGFVAFSVTDGKVTVPVRFEGPAPDTLKDEAIAVAEGTLGEDGVFRAVKLLARCPSKFESREPNP